jgi:hypothetical protein
MPFVICLPTPTGKVCFDIPVLVQRWNPPGPDPTRVWIRGLDISREIIADLSVLAGINELVNELKTPAMRKELSESLRSTIGQLKLPKEVGLEIVNEKT